MFYGLAFNLKCESFRLYTNIRVGCIIHTNEIEHFLENTSDSPFYLYTKGVTEQKYDLSRQAIACVGTKGAVKITFSVLQGELSLIKEESTAVFCRIINFLAIN